MGFVRSADDDVPVGYVSVIVDPSNGVARVDMLAGDPSLVALQMQDEVFRALGGWFFGVQNVRKAVFHVRSDNHATVAWLRRRATMEGRFRGEAVLHDGRIVDVLRFGLMADEWADVERGMDRASERPLVRRRGRAEGRAGLSRF